MLGESREDRIDHGELVAVSDDLALINHVARGKLQALGESTASRGTQT